MKHLVLLAATLGMAAMTAHSQAAELLRVAGVGHGAGYHANAGCQTCNKGAGMGYGSAGYNGYGGYVGCCGADYPQQCCGDVWDGYCDEPRCHFWERLHARLTTDRSCGAQACAPACCPPEYGINRLKKLFHCAPKCCVEEEPSCEAETEAAECCEPCCGHKGIFGWLRRACGGSSCSSDCGTEYATESSESSPLPPAPPAEIMTDPAL